MNTIQTFIVEDAKGIVLTVHGSGEHIGRYKHVAKWLNENNISMFGGDLPGLGRAAGIRGHIEQFDDYLKKIREWHNYIKQNWPNTPIFILGHSLGGLIVLRYLQELEDKSEFKGAIVSSPAVSIGIEAPEWQIKTAELLRKIWPTFRLKSGIKANQVSRDPVVVKNYEDDPYVYSKISVNWYFEFLKAIKEVWDNIDDLKGIDLLYLQAGEDQLVKPEAASEYVNKANNNRINFYLIPDLYHEIFNEPEKEEYLQLMSDWITART